MTYHSYHRDALRVLYILVKGSTPLDAPDDHGAVAIFRGEKRLHAFDFWMRNPDYLAEELLDLFETTRNPLYLAEARDIFKYDEPDIRRIPMIRFMFGAFEPLDDILALLRSRNLIRITGRKSGEKILETDFLLMPTAFEMASSISEEFPILGWYEKRASLVTLVAGSRSGTALKGRQYKQAEYAQTQLGGIIPPITERVKERLATYQR